MLILALALAYAGLTAISLSMPRHQRDAIGRTLTLAAGMALRAAGYTLLALAWWPCAIATSASVGLLMWIGMLAAAGFLLVALLGWKPRHAVHAGATALATASIAVIATTPPFLCLLSGRCS